MEMFGVVTMGEPPRVRSSCIVAPETWTRLPDDGFEILHSHTGNQAVDAHPLRVQIRRLGPQLPDSVPTGSIFTLSADGRTTQPIPYDATEEQRWAAEQEAFAAAAGERDCLHCEATDRVLAMARLLDDFTMSRLDDDAHVSGKLFDALVKVAEMVSKHNPLARKLAMTIVGVEP